MKNRLLFVLIFALSLCFSVFAEEDQEEAPPEPSESQAVDQNQSNNPQKVPSNNEDEEQEQRLQRGLNALGNDFKADYYKEQSMIDRCKARGKAPSCSGGRVFNSSTCECESKFFEDDEDESKHYFDSNISQKQNGKSSSFEATTPQSSSSEPPAPSITNKKMQDYLDECAQASVDAENTCDIDKNEDTSGFSSGMARLSSMLNKSGAANSSGGCAMLGAMGLAGGSILGGAKAECFSAKANCESACARAKSFLAEYSNFTDLVASYSKRCDKIKDVSQALIGNAAGMGSLVSQANNCRKNLPPSDDCLKNPIKCAFGNSSCKTEEDKRNKPTCFCQFVNPNDPMCAIVDQIQESSPNRDVASINTSSKLDTGGHLPLTPSPEPVEQVNPAEALLANSHPQPVGTIELAGKSGDGLGGGGGSVLGSAQKPYAQGKSAGSNISTKVNAGFLSASSFGIPPVVGTGPPVDKPKRFQMYKKAIKQMYPRMSKLDALALAHTLALRDVNHWLKLQDAVDQGQTEEQLTPLKAVLESVPVYMDDKKMVTAADFIVKKQNKEEKEESFYSSFIEFLRECFFYIGHSEIHPLMAFLSFILLAGISLIGAMIPFALFEKFYLKSPIVLRRKNNQKTFSQYLPTLSEQDQKQLFGIDFEKIGGFSVLYTYHYLWSLKNDLQYLNQALQKNGLTAEHKFAHYSQKVLLSCLFSEGQKDPEATGFVPMFLEKNERRLNYTLARYGLTNEMQWKYQKPISAEALVKTYGSKMKSAG